MAAVREGPDARGQGHQDQRCKKPFWSWENNKRRPGREEAATQAAEARRARSIMAQINRPQSERFFHLQQERRRRAQKDEDEEPSGRSEEEGLWPSSPPEP